MKRKDERKANEALARCVRIASKINAGNSVWSPADIFSDKPKREGIIITEHKYPSIIKTQKKRPVWSPANIK